ncbi:ceramidase-domain-containing protein [Xylaria palmicola]|nr:ceramidase-domain-containing protein [Xylaria palmicola]
MSALAFPYHEPRPGFWGEKTVTLNFCEEDYVMSYYCAEVCNTITNALFLWFGVRGIRNCMKYRHPPIFFITFIGYILVGCGSTLFHATLKYPMQLVDELAMIYTTCFMVHATFAYARSWRFSFALGIGLIGLAYFITARYYQTKDPQFRRLFSCPVLAAFGHWTDKSVGIDQDAYALLTATVVFSNMWIMEKVLRPALKAREDKRPSSSPVPSTRVLLSQMWIMVATGLSIFLGGFLIWNLDNIYCGTIRRWRHQIQLPWAVVLEGHAWWHLMTSIGVETQAIASQQQIALTRTQQAAKQREMRMAQLTRTELSSLPADTNVYEGVGKMFISLPVADMKGKLETQIRELEGDVDSLGKRLHYLEVSQKNSKDQINRMLRGGVGAS